MVEIIKAVTELMSVVVNIGPMGIAVLALIVALTAIWVLGGK